MKRICFQLFTVIGLLAIFTMAAMCAETYDPNAGSAVAEKSASGDRLSSDSHLSAKITFSGKKIPIRKVVEELTQMGGIALRAGTSNKDWEVRDRKVNVFAKETPLYEVMNAISRVTGFKWSIEEEENKPLYRIVWDPKSRQEVEALRESIQQTDDLAASDIRNQSLDSIMNLNNMSSEDLAKLKTSNPYLFWMAASSAGAVPSLKRSFTTAGFAAC